jgi:hypothetical protein
MPSGRVPRAMRGRGRGISSAYRPVTDSRMITVTRESKRCGEPLLLPPFRPLYVRNHRGGMTSPDQR